MRKLEVTSPASLSFYSGSNDIVRCIRIEKRRRARGLVMGVTLSTHLSPLHLG